MIKVVGFVRKREDLTRQQFKDYWLNEHSKLARNSLASNPVRKIVASFVSAELVGSTPFDGMVELYFYNIEDMRRHTVRMEPAQYIFAVLHLAHDNRNELLLPIIV